MRLGLSKDEKIIFEVRRHWFLLFLRVILIVFLAFVPLILFGLTKALYGYSPSTEISGLLSFLYSIWVLFMWMLLFVAWTDYYFDVWFVTNKRIIDIEQKGLFWRDIASLNFEKVQDVKTDVRGIFPTLLGYGYIYIQTAGEAREFAFRGAARPNYVRRKILKLYQEKLEEVKPVRIEKV